MLKQYHFFWTTLFKFTDVAIVMTAFLLPVHASSGGINDLAFLREVSISGSLVLLCWLVVSNALGLYRSRRLETIANDTKLLIVANVAVWLLLAALSTLNLFKDNGLLDFALFRFLLLSLAGTTLFHVVLRLILRDLRAHGWNQRRACDGSSCG